MKPLHPYSFVYTVFERSHGFSLSSLLAEITDKHQSNFSGKRLKISDRLGREVEEAARRKIELLPDYQKDFIKQSPGFDDGKLAPFQTMAYWFHPLHESFGFAEKFDALFLKIPEKAEFSEEDIKSIQNIVSETDWLFDDIHWSITFNGKIINYRESFYNAQNTKEFTENFNLLVFNLIHFFIAGFDVLTFKHYCIGFKPASFIEIFYEHKSKEVIGKDSSNVKYSGKVIKRPFRRLLEFIYAIAYRVSDKNKKWPTEACKPKDLAKCNFWETKKLDRLFNGSQQKLTLKEYEQFCKSIFESFHQPNNVDLRPFYFLALVDDLYFYEFNKKNFSAPDFFGYMHLWEYQKKVFLDDNDIKNPVEWPDWLYQ